MRELGICRGSHRSPAAVLALLALLFFLLPMQMKSDAFSVLKLPLCARRQDSRWRARQACKYLQAGAEPFAGTSTQMPSLCWGHTRVSTPGGCRAETLAKKKPQNPRVIAPAFSRPRALLLCCSPQPRVPISAGARSEAISYSYIVSEISLFFVLFCSAGAALERWCQKALFCLGRAPRRNQPWEEKASESLPTHLPWPSCPGQGGFQE